MINTMLINNVLFVKLSSVSEKYNLMHETQRIMRCVSCTCFHANFLSRPSTVIKVCKPYATLQVKDGKIRITWKVAQRTQSGQSNGTL